MMNLVTLIEFEPPITKSESHNNWGAKHHESQGFDICGSSHYLIVISANIRFSTYQDEERACDALVWDSEDDWDIVAVQYLFQQYGGYAALDNFVKMTGYTTNATDAFTKAFKVTPTQFQKNFEALVAQKRAGQATNTSN